MCYTEGMKPEETIARVLEDKIRGIHPSHWIDIAHDIVEALEKEKSMNEDTDVRPGNIEGGMSSPYFDGNQIPSPYIHDGSARTYDWPEHWPQPNPNFAEDEVPVLPDDDIGPLVDVTVYETHIRNQIENMASEIAYIAELPMWNKKERRRLEKAYNKLYVTIYGQDYR